MNLLEGFLSQAEKNPDKTALIIGYEQPYVSYCKLYSLAGKTAKVLLENGAKPHDRIALSLERGTELIAGVLGILWAGCVYVPINPAQPLQRRDSIYKKADIKYCLTYRDSPASKYENCRNIMIEDCLNTDENDIPSAYNAESSDSAYIIFTSGSTGTPKGVEIQHGSALNTINDIQERYNFSENDCAIAVSAIDFDLSVFDIFGLLSVGGSILLLEEKNKKEPQEWIKQIKKYNVTVWNSVPALFEMLMYSLEEKQQLESLRLVMLSGDWVKKTVFADMKKHCPNSRLVALGGATEASIWSNYFEVNEVKEEWNAIPYGTPLKNQKFRIVKDGKDTEVNEIGELWIGGKGLAKGYAGEEELTAKVFVTESGERWYKTGDSGYFDSDGIMIFTGRIDQQVKVNGMRIELGEVESKLLALDNVKSATALVKKSDNASVLVSVIEPENHGGDCKVNISDSSLDTENSSDKTEYAVKELVNGILTEFDGTGENLSGTLRFWKKWNEEHTCSEKSDSKWNEIISGKKELFRKIFRGEELPQAILEDKDLSPAELFANSDEGIKLTEILSEKLEKYLVGKKNQTVGFIGGRQGKIYLPVIKAIEKYDVKIVYFESSNGLLRDAKDCFKDINADISYKKLAYPCIDSEMAESADVLVLANNLHTFKNIDKGLKYIQILLKPDGAVFGIENTSLSPMGVITASVLENGFSDYDIERRNLSPMMSSEKWCKYLAESGFKSITGEKFESEDYFVFCAEGKCTKYADKEEIEQHCRNNLLEYMIPQQVLYAVEMPLSSNGKVDRKKILEWFENENTGTEPETETEKSLADIWAELLGNKKIYKENSFLEIGGDSLLISRMTAEIRNKYGVQLSMKDVFADSTLKNISALIDGQLADADFEEGEI